MDTWIHLKVLLKRNWVCKHNLKFTFNVIADDNMTIILFKIPFYVILMDVKQLHNIMYSNLVRTSCEKCCKLLFFFFFGFRCCI